MKTILHLTQHCNLRCRYCYAASEHRTSMSFETACKAIDHAISQGKESACISYFGGEPLLMFDMIRECTAYARAQGRKAGKAMHFRLSTNGTLLNDDILRFCRNEGMLFAVSLDGDREAHDAQRPTAEGTGSFEAIDARLDRILQTNPYTVFVSVVTPSNAGRLLSSIEYMWSRGIRYMVHQAAFSDPSWDRESFETLRQSYLDLADWYVDATRSGEFFFMHLFDDKIRTHARAPVKLGQICDFGLRKFSVAPDGRYFPCVQFVSDKKEADDYCIGHVDTGFTARREELIAENRKPRPACKGCAFQGRCGNYCGCMNWQTTGKLTEVSPFLCEHERMLIPIADEVGNRLWDEKNPSFLDKHYRHIGTYLKETAAYGID